jgi:translation initiation factor RLI1
VPKRVAVIVYRECDPAQCAPEDGVCPATKLCKRRILTQEAPGECPMIMPSDMCQACGDCVAECGRQAIVMQER